VGARVDDAVLAVVLRAVRAARVVWPTVLAHDVVHAAVRHAERRAAAGNGRDALAAAEHTRQAFDAVDNGGLDAVWL
jgi:hypothetical protein